jgi:hypothetical protein
MGGLQLNSIIRKALKKRLNLRVTCENQTPIIYKKEHALY